MDVETYTKEIEAVYFDGVTDVEQIANWCGGMVVEIVDQEGRIRRDIYAIDVPLGNGQFVTAGKDFYVLKDGNFFFTMPAGDFESAFTKKSE